MSKQDMSKNLTSINSLCSVLKFSGDGVLDFLNNLLISDLTSFKHKQFYYSALCNPKGRIISSVILYISDSQNTLLYCPTNMLSNLSQFFTMRKFRLKFSITENQSSKNISPNSPTHFLFDTLTAQSNDELFLTLFNQNLPWIDSNNTEKFIPQHVNLDQHDDIMSFTKGCYPGQEIIARLKYLGKIKKRMKLITVNSESEIESILSLVSPIVQLPNNQFQVQVLITTNL